MERSPLTHVPAEPVPLASAARAVFVHDGAPGFLARRVRSLGLPYSIDVAVPAPLVQECLRAWSRVFPETRLCERADAQKASKKRSARGARRVRLWSHLDFVACGDHKDVVVAEELQDWPAEYNPHLAIVKTRIVVVGCSSTVAQLLELLPDLRARDFYECAAARRCAAHVIEPNLGPPAHLPPSCVYVSWVGFMADELLCQIRRGLRATLPEHWTAFKAACFFSTRQLGAQHRSQHYPWEAEKDTAAVELVHSWTLRTALLACAASPSRGKNSLEAAELCAAFNDDFHYVCPKCLSQHRPSRCDWDALGAPGAEVVEGLEYASAWLVSRYVLRLTRARVLFAQQVLREARGLGVPPIPRPTTTAALLLIRWWAAVLKARGGDKFFEFMMDPRSPLPVEKRPGAALHLCGYLERRVFGKPAIGDHKMEPIAPYAMEDNAALRAFTWHMARAHSFIVHVAQPRLMDFLGVNWTLVADDAALCRWSFEREVVAVYIYPSFLMDEGAETRMDRVLRRWPNARIFWRDAENTPTAFAYGML